MESRYSSEDANRKSHDNLGIMLSVSKDAWTVFKQWNIISPLDRVGIYQVVLRRSARPFKSLVIVLSSLTNFDIVETFWWESFR